MTETEHFDVVLVGAGISALGFAHHLQEQCQDKSFVLIEEKDTFGGTWVTHTYPGVRSDSDLYTFGYRFKPWSGKPVASGNSILEYLGQVIEDDNLSRRIRFGQRIIAANWSTEDARWELSIEQVESGEVLQISCNFFIWTGGYYDHHQGYTPDWPGFEDYTGQVIHPQHWPDSVDLTGKCAVVIGSGATAATLVPNIADECAHVTMLQRSPTYFWTDENRNELADRLRKLEVPEECVHEIVRRDLLQTAREIQFSAEQYPEEVKKELLNGVRKFIGEELTEKHFIPSYRPWQQRLAYVPDGDLFKAVKDGAVSIVTDHIARFDREGIVLESGDRLDADVVITATGFNLSVMGGIPFSVDGSALEPTNSYTYRGIMLSDFPNFAQMFGYLRTSWTMRVDLVADYLCRLIKHMDAKQAQVVTPKLRPQDQDMPRNRWISEDQFNPGYIRRGACLMPSSGDRDPWRFSPDYYVEKDQMPKYDLDEDTLIYR